MPRKNMKPFYMEDMMKEDEKFGLGPSKAEFIDEEFLKEKEEEAKKEEQKLLKVLKRMQAGERDLNISEDSVKWPMQQINRLRKQLEDWKDRIEQGCKFVRYRTSESSWNNYCGREYYMLVRPSLEGHEVLDNHLIMMN